jgi:chromosome segregation ATPase
MADSVTPRRLWGHGATTTTRRIKSVHRQIPQEENDGQTIMSEVDSARKEVEQIARKKYEALRQAYESRLSSLSEAIKEIYITVEGDEVAAALHDDPETRTYGAEYSAAIVTEGLQREQEIVIENLVARLADAESVAAQVGANLRQEVLDLRAGYAHALEESERDKRKLLVENSELRTYVGELDARLSSGEHTRLSREVADLRDELDTVRKEGEHLQGRLSFVEKERCKLGEALENCKRVKKASDASELESMQSKCRRLQESVSNSDQETARAKQECDRLLELLKDSDKSVAQFKQDLDVLRRQNETLVSQASKLQAESSSLSHASAGDLSAWRSYADELKAENAKMATQIEEFQARTGMSEGNVEMLIRSSDEAIDQLKQENSQLSASLELLQSQWDGAASRLTFVEQLQEENISLHERLESLCSQADESIELRRECVSLRGRLSECMVCKSELEAMLRSANVKLANALKKQSLLSAAKKREDVELAQMQQAHATLSAEIDCLKEAEKLHASQWASSKAELESLGNELEAERAKVKKQSSDASLVGLAEGLEEAVANISHLRDLHATEGRKRKFAEDALARTEADLSKALSDLTQTREIIPELESMSSKALEELEKRHERVKQLEAQLQAQSCNSSQLGPKLLSARKGLMKMRRELLSIKGSASDHREEISQIFSVLHQSFSIISRSRPPAVEDVEAAALRSQLRDAEARTKALEAALVRSQIQGSGSASGDEDSLSPARGRGRSRRRRRQEKKKESEALDDLARMQYEGEISSLRAQIDAANERYRQLVEEMRHHREESLSQARDQIAADVGRVRAEATEAVSTLEARLESERRRGVELKARLHKAAKAAQDRVAEAESRRTEALAEADTARHELGQVRIQLEACCAQRARLEKRLLQAEEDAQRWHQVRIESSLSPRAGQWSLRLKDQSPHNASGTGSLSGSPGGRNSEGGGV